MDGQRTVQDIWELSSTKLGDDGPTQPEVVQLLSQLHAADVLQCDIPPDIAELLHRHERTQQKKWQRRADEHLCLAVPALRPGAFSTNLRVIGPALLRVGRRGAVALSL